MRRRRAARIDPSGVGFRLRFVGSVVLALLFPLVAGAWFLAGELEAREVDRADARLAAALRVAPAELRADVVGADARARRLASSPRVQRALLERDRAALARLAGTQPNVAFYAGRTRLAGSTPHPSLTRSIDVVSPRRVLGRVVVGIPLDDALLRRLRATAALRSRDLLVLVSSGRVIAGPLGLDDRRIELEPGRAGDVRLASGRYRALAVPLVQGGSEMLVAATPKEAIDARASVGQRRVALASLATLLALAVGALGVAPVAERRVRARWEEEEREALAHLADALGAAHDPNALLRVILETMVESTGAVGGRLFEDGKEVAHIGEPAAGAEPLRLELVEDDGATGLILLYPPPGGLSDEARRLAGWLAERATIALENARRHAIAQHEAVTDPLTGLANRRRFVRELSVEVNRAQRFQHSLAIVLADLDDFKSVNDRFGHLTGDDALRAFADVLRDRVRDIDLPVRFGGEEFAVLLRETTLAGARALAEELRTRLQELTLTAPDGRRFRVTASFGVAAYPEDGAEDELLAAADAALYRAKQQGKNRVAVAEAQSKPSGDAPVR